MAKLKRLVILLFGIGFLMLTIFVGYECIMLIGALVTYVDEFLVGKAILDVFVTLCLVMVGLLSFLIGIELIFTDHAELKL